MPTISLRLDGVICRGGDKSRPDVKGTNPQAAVEAGRADEKAGGTTPVCQNPACDTACACLPDPCTYLTNAKRQLLVVSGGDGRGGCISWGRRRLRGCWPGRHACQACQQQQSH